ncbi:MAG TPA: heat-inducible transcriptional repressor HrcA [Pseudomonadota bacterium]|jgi:heat-inducible transcriptional repressor|nr:heat-inducible transcriptional repressor HrcA [Pseudomonadota bacterium]HNI59536.1 heat-inducible transcriptional repressor HrcA [Pseudomonadota bacterium]HNK45582.1 heat-inducible transcriptional repressor HrcA [Pseudomonadota bacterium]HNN51507.1 heat-inducible transcriptional repressor HrcA [Pseudomonadota bacterium]HNO67280.1 heat-inducible transcriptional repressor HrcA [Pseudomonadota bacterium]
MLELNNRARKILSAITQEYLSTGEAVGSRTVTRRYGVDLSPASVRNVMADLEELGLIRQPHASAGRVPTDLGLRFFVDSLLKIRQLSSRDREEMAGHYNFSTGEVDAVLREAGQVLSDLSTHTVVVMTPRVDLDVLKHIEFVRVKDNAVVAVLVNTSGRVLNKLVTLDEPIAPDLLDRITNYLNSFLDGKTLSEARSLIEKELAKERTRYDAQAKLALRLSAQALPAEPPSVIVSGQANLLSHVLSEEAAPTPERLKALFRTLEDHRQLLRLLEQTEAAHGIQVFIGAETSVPEFSDKTVVAASYGPNEKPVGALGVIGPTRMNYSRVIALVDFTAQLLSGVIAQNR